MTLAIESFETEDELDAVEHPAPRFQLGDPGYADTGVPNDHLYYTCARQIDPDFWPWRPSHPDHDLFVAEFWESYALQALHFATIAEEEGVRMYSLGTETDRLFRTRPGGDYWINHFGTELQSMVDRVRAVYSGLLTYDMHYGAYWRDWFAPGSWRLWEDLDMDVIGVSSWFPLVDEPPTTVLDVDSLRREYERIFRDHLIPMAERNPGRPLVFLEYAAVDTVEAPTHPSRFPDNSSLVFADTNGNGLDDGQEVQDNMYRALFETMEAQAGCGAVPGSRTGPVCPIRTGPAPRQDPAHRVRTVRYTTPSGTRAGSPGDVRLPGIHALLCEDARRPLPVGAQTHCEADEPDPETNQGGATPADA